MDNQITDQLQLVEEIPFKAFPLIGYILPAIEGKSQEIFREGKCIGSVYPPDQQSLPIKVRNGDVIYRVQLLSQTYDCAGSLITVDHYIRTYELYLELQVTDSFVLLQRYLQRIDR